jgi:purine-binding chemotaxis protein CheW
MSDIQQYIVSRINDELFAMNISYVHEILMQPEITKVPTKIPYLIGLIKVRNMVIPLVNVRKKFYNSDELAKNPVVIIVQEPNLRQMIGLVVDEVKEVVSIPENVIDHPLLFSGQDGEEMVLGVARLSAGLVIIMNVEKIFTDVDKTAFEKAIKTGEKKLL